LRAEELCRGGCLEVRRDLERDEGCLGERAVAAAIEAEAEGRFRSLRELRSTYGNLHLGSNEAKTANEVTKREVVRAFRGAAEKRKFARGVRAVIEPR